MLEGRPGRHQVDDPFLAIVADAERFEDDPVALLPELEPEARDLERTLVFQGPRLERYGQTLSVRLDIVAEGLPQAGQEGRCGSGDFGFGHEAKEGCAPLEY